LRCDSAGCSKAARSSRLCSEHLGLATALLQAQPVGQSKNNAESTVKPTDDTSGKSKPKNDTNNKNQNRKRKRAQL